ncbi:MAG: hypothetical protein Q8P18_01740 [Pseudomonadota bacterium]|nr:hypothetical protein [Pseudomonadota bacterium]
MLALRLLLPIVAPAHAAIYSGNPELWIKVDRPAHDFVEGGVVLHEIQTHTCAGGLATYVYDVAIDPVAGWSTQVGGGNLCGITLVWGSPLGIDGPAYAVVYSEEVTEVLLGATIPPVALTPFSVVYGNYSGTAPHLFLTLK